MAIVLGIFTALLSDQQLQAAVGGAGNVLAWGLEAWRWMFLVGVVPSLVYFLIAWRIPESPRYLVNSGKGDLAAPIIARLQGIPLTDAQEVTEALQAGYDHPDAPAQLSEKRGFALLRNPSGGLWPVVWVGLGVAAFQQLVGINVIFYYSTDLWASVGFGTDFAFTASVITSVINIVSTVAGIMLIDKVGRRALLLWGAAAMAVTQGLMALTFSQAQTVNGAMSLPGIWGPIGLVGANAFVVAFGVTWGGAMWTLLGEIFPNSIRGLAMSVSSATNWIANFAVTMTFPALAAWSLPGAYVLYAAFAILAFFFVYARVPETQGVPLEAMTTAAGRHALDSARLVTQ
jgi:sugar porter (SP) family MFS transporter